MNLMEILQGQISDDMLGQLSQHIGAEPQQTATAAQGIFATILGGLANNATSENGLASLASALDKDHDGSILDDIMGMASGMLSGQQSTGAANGLGILGHILGDRQETAAEQIGQSSGLSAGQIMKLMPILAPIVMGVLGRAKSQGNLGLGDLAGILMGGAQQVQQDSGLGGLLGSVLGSVLGGGQQQQQQQPAQGGDLMSAVLGGIFGRR